MRVNLGVIEISDRHRRALREHLGKAGLASRKEVQMFVGDLLDKALGELEACLMVAEEEGKDASATWAVVRTHDERGTRLDPFSVLTTHRKQEAAEWRLRILRKRGESVLARNERTGDLYNWTLCAGVQLLERGYQ